MDGLVVIGSLVMGYWLWYTHLRKKGWARWAGVVVGAVMAVLVAMFAPLVIYGEMGAEGKVLAAVISVALLFPPLRSIWRHRQERFPAEDSSGQAAPLYPQDKVLTDGSQVQTIDDKSTGRRALRSMCRDALSDKAISKEEALLLCGAFTAHCLQFPSESTHIGVIRDRLREVTEDGSVDPHESHELVTLLGEFADFGLYHGEVNESSKTKTKTKTKTQADRTVGGRDVVVPIEVQPGKSYQLTYTDSDGDSTIRQVKATRLEQRGDRQYLISYCLKARAPRTFRVDRITSMIDTETGEIILQPYIQTIESTLTMS